MGRQPRPVDDEVERALASMRAGFLSGSAQIAANVTALEEHLADAPRDEREGVRATVARLIATQRRLNSKVARLPAAPWDQFKVMVSVVKAQQTVLDQLGHLVKEHVLPRQVENLQEAKQQSDAAQRARTHSRARARARADDGPDDDEPRSLFALVRERTAGFSGLAAMVVAGIVLSLFPRDVKLQDMAAKFVEMVRTGSVSAPSGDGNWRALENPLPAPAPRVGGPRTAERVPALPDAAATDRPGSADSKPPEQKLAAAPVPVPPPAPPPRAPVASRAEPPAVVQPSPKRTATAAPPAVEERSAANTTEEQFVPVVFTHKDHEAVMQALTDLKQQFPKLLIGRKGEVQPVDLGKKGVWHRLVFLPAGSRPQAARLCDQLAAEGYDRCWVKAY